MKIRRVFVVLLVPVLFFLLSLFTLTDYGISWDEPIHFHRGQAYLHYFLTGKITYEDLPTVREHFPKYEHYSPPEGRGLRSLSEFRRSYYQADSLPADWFLQNDGGHPPLNDILAALFNFIFYQKLGILGDIESHHLFNIVSATLLVLVVTVFAYQVYGVFAGAVAGITLSLYPLFFSEAHFNIKDPPESAFFAATIWAFWLSLQKSSWRWLLVAILSFSLALGTKFNIIFLPFILGPYLLIRYYSILRSGWNRVFLSFKKIPKPYLLLLLASPLIVATIFFGTWPFLWQDPIGNFLKIVGYYKEIGTGSGYQPGFFFSGGFNFYPSFWILITTPPWILLLTAIGIIYGLRHWREKEYVPILWILWLLVPIFRVTLPNTTIYGGVRQIMEYIPAMALLSGLGALVLREWLARKIGQLKIQRAKALSVALILLGFIPHLFIMAKIHPNQNVYFNSLIGGLRGAKARNIPYWGNSFGNAYWQAIKWLNENAEPNARLALIQGTGLNVPRIMLRSDIQYWNGYWSGIKREGEYLMELTHHDPNIVYPYAWDYVEKFLEPVYEVEVDGVAIAKVWKNDLEHTRPELRKEEVNYNQNDIRYSIEKEVLEIELKESKLLSRLLINFSQDSNCGAVGGRIEISGDGENWHRETESISTPQINEKENLENNRFQFFFPAKSAQFIKLIADNPESCILNNPQIQILILE